MSIESELRQEFDRAEHREAAVLKALPYLLLTAGALITLAQPMPVNIPAVLGLTLVTAVWLAGLQALNPKWRFNGPLMGLHYAGLMALCAGLVVLAPWYGIFAFFGYVHAFMFLKGPWRYVGVGVTSMIMAVTYMGGTARINADEWGLWGAIGLVSTVLAATFFYFAEKTDQHGRRQRRALTELHEANVKLEAALEENLGLHAQLLTQARETGALDERQRMAREIHDTLAQSLAGILTQLEAAEGVQDDRSAMRRHMTNARDLAREGFTEARRSVQAMKPQALADARLPDAIGDVARRWSEVNRIEAALTVTGEPRRMHTDVEVALLRGAQEALANVAKHAKADHVGLTLSYMKDLVTLDVRDDGVGFDANAEPVNGSATGGFGLSGMRQRVQRANGRLDIESEPGAGTAISASVPAIPAGGGQ